jgi:hypothetical protein
VILATLAAKVESGDILLICRHVNRTSRALAAGDGRESQVVATHYKTVGQSHIRRCDGDIIRSSKTGFRSGTLALRT